MLIRRFHAWPARRAVAAALALTLGASSCATYAPRPGPPDAALAHERMTAARVTLRDGRTIEVQEPAVRVDSVGPAAHADTVLAGFVFDAKLGRREPVTVPMHDVVAVSARVADHRVNGAMLIGVGVVVLTVTTFVLYLFATCGDRCLD